MKITSTQQVALASLLWAFSALTRKLVLVSISPFLLNYLNCIFAIILVAVFSRTNLKELPRLFLENKLLFFLNSFFGVTLGLSFAYYSLERIDLSLYGLLVKLQPIFVILLACIFLKEKIAANKIPLIIIAIISSFLISYNSELNFKTAQILGMIAAILTALTISISTITGKALIQKNLSSRPNYRLLDFLSEGFY
jgi:drug/metabolite transporter (DMT)-like permease